LRAETANADATIYNTLYTASEAMLKPFILPHSAITPAGFTANWSEVGQAIKYELVYADNAAFTNSTSIELTENKFVFADLKQTSVFYKVRVITATDTSEWANGEFMVAPGNAISLVGTNLNASPYVQIPQLTLGDSYTVDQWINLKSITSNYVMFHAFGNSADALTDNSIFVFYRQSNGKLELWQNNTSTTATIKSNGLNEWAHLVTVVKKDSLFLYLNGENILKYKTATPNTAGVRNYCYIGRAPYSSLSANSYMNAHLLVDEFRVYNRALTEAEILANAHKLLSGNEDDLIVYYNFDQVSGNIVPNLAKSGSIYNGTVHNNANFTASKALLTPFIRSVDTVKVEEKITKLNIAWDKIEGGTYEYAVATSADFAETTEFAVLTDATAALPIDGKQYAYFYRVRAISAVGVVSDWSTGSFIDSTASIPNMALAGGITINNTTDIKLQEVKTIP
jgi:hypothetical protein